MRYLPSLTRFTAAGRVLALAALAAALGAGCQATGTKLTEEHLLAYPKGLATYHEIVAKFGPPTSMTKRDDGTRQAIYDYHQSQIDGESFLPYAYYFIGGSSGEMTQTILEFDAEDILRMTTFTQGQTKTGTGIFSGGRQK